MGTWVICGASSGIGKETARLLMAQGHEVIMASRKLEILKQLSQEFNQEYSGTSYVRQVDYSQVESIDAFVSWVIDTFPSIDGLISCVGYGDFKAAVDFSYQEIDKMMHINTVATMYLCNLFAQKMLEQGFGHISVIASVAGKLATMHSSVYSASKFAIIGYANALRLELKPFGISVTTINPGPVATPFFQYNDTLKHYYDRIKTWSLDPQYVAQCIIKNIGLKKPKREINLPYWMHKLVDVYDIAPTLGDWLLIHLFNFKEESS